jgi:hypothetical protein
MHCLCTAVGGVRRRGMATPAFWCTTHDQRGIGCGESGEWGAYESRGAVQTLCWALCFGSITVDDTSKYFFPNARCTKCELK